MSDFIYDNLGWLLFGAIVCLFGVILVAASQDGKNRERFMQECQQDHKRYECEALWRSGEPDVVTVPVVIPVR